MADRDHDLHRLERDKIATIQAIKHGKQALRNYNAWLVLAKRAITERQLDVAIARIQQAQGLVHASHPAVEG